MSLIMHLPTTNKADSLRRSYFPDFVSCDINSNYQLPALSPDTFSMSGPSIQPLQAESSCSQTTIALNYEQSEGLLSMSKAVSEPQAQPRDRNELPEDFTPGPWSVLVGRDKKSIEAPGTKRLQVIIGWYLERYTKSHGNKDDKSAIISEIEATIRNANNIFPDGAFVRHTNGKWHQVESCYAREKIGRMLRESLHQKYSSSSKQKRARRKSRQQSLLLTAAKANRKSI